MDKKSLGIIEAVQKLIHLSESEYGALLSRVTTSVVLKGEELLRPGQICRSLSYLEVGSMTHNRYSQTGNLHIVDLSVPGDWVLDHVSFTKQSQSDVSIVAIDDCKVSSINIGALHELIEISNKYFVLGSLFYASDLQNFMNQPDVSPDERYLYLLENRPEILRIFPLKDIASFMRMTPETLSRVRRRVRKG